MVASMLVSPIMGPVLALTFGVHLRKFKFAKALAKLGLKNECYSLLICIVVGFIVGGILIAVTQNDPQNVSVWPTSEMYGRGLPSGLATGAIVAFASGIGVALSVVGDYMATVIGVAISASLLPPAVNCGMLWAQSVYVSTWDGTGHNPGCNETDCYTPSELAIMGTISIVLTIENIFLVFLASMMMFWVKDVTLSKERGFDDQNKQLVYQSITSFKDRYDDIKTRTTQFSLTGSKQAITATKGVLGNTVDDQAKKMTLKRALIGKYNTLRGGDTSKLKHTRSMYSHDVGDDSQEEEDEQKIDLYKQTTDSGMDAINETEPLVKSTNVNDGYVQMTQTDEEQDK